ncbi:MAG: chorismate mutase [Candidatus Methanoplasma sp.]|jgi:chorismate mutase|nr:chorismate mutase [Candidatus Methanoplasma sp.]
MTDLERLRADIRAVDNDIMILLKRRMELARSVGEFKIGANKDVRDLSVEEAVVRRYREFAENNGMDPDKAEAVCRLIMQESVEIQEALRN